jgi:structural toxin protein (hemagglutinin/hemolysin) RtxA
MSDYPEYILCFYVPEEYAETVKNKVFEAGAGRLGDYENCCWQTLGEGQFRPVQGAMPFIGEQNRLERLKEFKVEMICQSNELKAVVQALKKAHPYEEPAFHVLKLETGF